VTKTSPAVLTCVLGSCLGIALYDPIKKNGSLAHAMLPSIKNATRRGLLKPKKYVDSAIEVQLKQMLKLGSKPKDIVAKLIGGASMFKGTKMNPIFNIGDRNAEIAIKILNEKKIKIKSKDLGRTFGRTVKFSLYNGYVRIFKAGGAPWRSI
jgi:chemotaxis protein CheD